jgi:regulator of sigma E protease
VTAVWFVLLVGLLTAVHELGHLAAARLFRIKILRLSFGFGPILFSKRGRETEYCVSAVPLGGYVRLLGEDPSDPIVDADRGRAFHEKPAWQRLVVIFAGPAANLIFPALVFIGLDAGPTMVPSAAIGTVFAGQPGAAADLRTGDRVIEIDGDRIDTWDELNGRIRDAPGRELKLTIERSGIDKPLMKYVTPREHRLIDELGRETKIGLIGVASHVRLAQVGVIDPASSAYRAGLRTFDVITSIQGRPVATLADIHGLLKPRTGDMILVTYLRPRAEPFTFVSLAELEPGSAQIIPEIDRSHHAAPSYDAGLRGADLFLYDVEPDSPAARLGLRRGDVITGLDGAPVGSWESFAQELAERPTAEHQLSWLTPEQPRVERAATFRLTRRPVIDEFEGELEVYAFGAEGARAAIAGPTVALVRGPGTAFVRGISQTITSTRTMVHVIGDTLLGRLSTTTIGGPIMLFQAAKVSAERGSVPFLRMAALVSLNLGLLNLLPVPMLDGGQATFVIFERLRGRSLAPRTMRRALYIGAVLLAALMLIASINDLVRMFFR